MTSLPTPDAPPQAPEVGFPGFNEFLERATTAIFEATENHTLVMASLDATSAFRLCRTVRSIDLVRLAHALLLEALDGETGTKLTAVQRTNVHFALKELPKPDDDVDGEVRS